MRRVLPLASLPLALSSLLACGHQPDGKPAVEPPQVLVGPGATREGEVALAAWLLYGATKAKLYVEHPPPAANHSADDFTLELGARQAQSEFWAEQQQKGAPAQAELDRQVRIWQAGFLPELVVTVQARPGWTIPAAAVFALRLRDFVTRFAGDYAPGAPVTLKTAAGKEVPDEPGADFPDPATLPLGPESCGQATAVRAAAWQRWRAIAGALGGVPVAANSTLHFGRQLLAIQRAPEGYQRGVTWVSPRVAHLALVDGFCAIEAHDWPGAVAALTRAAELDPSAPTPHLELSMALTMVRQFQPALHQVDLAMAASDDGCTVATALRRRGYILFELGALMDARAAYEKSLTIDPDNPIALGELRTIAAAEKQRGESAVRVPFEAPPAGNISVSKCRPADLKTPTP